MKGYYVQVHVEKDVNMSVQNNFMAHEVPVLMSVFGEGAIRLASDNVVAVKDGVDPAEEYRRLERKYGTDASGAFHVTNVYGQVFTGEFAKALSRGPEVVGIKLDEAKPKTKPKTKPKPSTVATGTETPSNEKSENVKDPLS